MVNPIERTYSGSANRRPLRALLALVALLGFSAFAGAVPITGLTIQIGDLGEIRLHVGTSDFTPTGNEGIGRATPNGEQSGFYPANGMTLAQAARRSGEHHFNWLQVVTRQPPGHLAPFGPVPHADPSSDPDNPTPRDAQPWYLNEGPDGTPPANPINPPFDLPAGTATLLPFQDFPSGFALGDSIEFDTYLVSILKQGAVNEFDVLAGFNWKITNQQIEGEAAARNHVVALAEIFPVLPQSYLDIVFTYEDQKWIVPEPGVAVLVLIGLVAWAATARRGRQCRRS